jgi:hypothetical protein
VSESRALKNIFGSNRVELKLYWRQVQDEELHDLTKCYASNKIKKIEMGRACGTYGEEMRCIESFDGET